MGTWPDSTSSTNAIVVHGGQKNVEGEDIELVRMCIYPALVGAGVPFSSVHTDDSEGPGDLQQVKLIDDAASHLVIMTPGLQNFKEAVTRAYLAGRGNKNVHVVTHNLTSYNTPGGNTPVPNIVGPDFTTTQRARIIDAERTLEALAGGSSEYKSFDGDGGFQSTVIVGNPDDLKRTKTLDVAQRAKKWKDALGDLPFKTDISQILGAAYVAGMVSPSQTSRFLSVNKALIEDSEEWLGRVRTFKEMAAIKAPGEHPSDDDPQRIALAFFSRLVV